MDVNSQKSFWDSKPYWCQPWSILSFGVLVLIFSWKLFNNIIFSSVVGFFVSLWWILFLIFAPNSYQVINDKEQS
jgi:SWI/SNF-related matrix-associated actin-dependent regulator of chromatin subfamily A member 5